MKIESSPLSFTEQNPQQATGPDLFAAWLTVKHQGSSGDDYYRRHQEQLQQSALRFDARPASVSQPVSPGQPVRQPSSEEPDLSGQEQSAGRLRMVSAYQADYSCLPRQPLSSSDRQSLLQMLKDNTGIALSFANSPPERASGEAQAAHTPGAGTVSRNPHSSHQLFVDDRQVELSLNTRELRPNEVRELKKQILQWIRHKGYTLTRLIINGVTQ
ncbi:hypothetical protein [Legionella sp. CNM-4043-24]|uniref:hypothetical protein n=1 Tax=Legionella sp. CNM-4043-24 TaxID=3421646 RepID=UPI00403ACD3E